MVHYNVYVTPFFLVYITLLVSYGDVIKGVIGSDHGDKGQVIHCLYISLNLIITSCLTITHLLHTFIFHYYSHDYMTSWPFSYHTPYNALTPLMTDLITTIVLIEFCTNNVCNLTVLILLLRSNFKGKHHHIFILQDLNP